MNSILRNPDLPRSSRKPWSKIKFHQWNFQSVETFHVTFSTEPWLPPTLLLRVPESWASPVCLISALSFAEASIGKQQWKRKRECSERERGGEKRERGERWEEGKSVWVKRCACRRPPRRIRREASWLGMSRLSSRLTWKILNMVSWPLEHCIAMLGPYAGIPAKRVERKWFIL